MRAYLAYATDLSAGVLSPSKVDPEISRQPVAPPAAALLSQLEDAPIADVLTGLEPATPDYRRLVGREGAARGLWPDAAWGPEVSDGADAPSRRQRPAGGRAARAARPGSATSLPAAEDSAERRIRRRSRGCGQGVPARLRSGRRRRRGRAHARRAQRAGRGAAGAGDGQPGAPALDEPSISARAT